MSRTVFLSSAMPDIYNVCLMVSLEATCGEALGEDPFMDDSFELDHLLSASASVLDICDASGSRPLPEEAVAMEEASAEVIYFHLANG